MRQLQSPTALDQTVRSPQDMRIRKLRKPYANFKISAPSSWLFASFKLGVGDSFISGYNKDLAKDVLSLLSLLQSVRGCQNVCCHRGKRRFSNSCGPLISKSPSFRGFSVRITVTPLTRSRKATKQHSYLMRAGHRHLCTTIICSSRFRHSFL